MEYILDNRIELFGRVFYGTIIGLFFLELFIPFRTQAEGSVWLRWVNNILLGGLNQFLARFLSSISLVAVAILAENYAFGFLNKVTFHFLFEIVIVFVILDLVGYFSHRLFHYYPALWKVHSVHHSDFLVDITTSVRHHPVEALITTVINATVILLLGAPAICVLFYQIFRFVISTFSHANVKLPCVVDRVLSLIIVTPQFHRVHHSSDKVYTDSNYSSGIIWWDYIFGTNQTLSRKEQESMELGLEYYRADRDQVVDRLIMQPFRFSVARRALKEKPDNTL